MAVTTEDRARAAVARAIKRGTLVRPSKCQSCGAPSSLGKDGRSLLHAHHHVGYDSPLDVMWLCVSCHFQLDRRPSGEKNGRAKLSREQVAEIRRRHVKGANRHRVENSGAALAREFGVSPCTVNDIVRNLGWIDHILAEKP